MFRAHEVEIVIVVVVMFATLVIARELWEKLRSWKSIRKFERNLTVSTVTAKKSLEEEDRPEVTE